MTDASNTCIGAVLQQKVGNQWKPLRYYSKKLSDALKKYSTYDKELLGSYMALVHFRNMLEGRPLTIYTDHKPLNNAFSKIGSDKETSRRTRKLLYISEFTSDIQHVEGSENIVADALSRVEAIQCPTSVDFAEVARAQETDTQLTTLQNDKNSNLQFKTILLPSGNISICCEVSSNRARPYLPKEFRKLARETRIEKNGLTKIFLARYE